VSERAKSGRIPSWHGAAFLRGGLLLIGVAHATALVVWVAQPAPRAAPAYELRLNPNTASAAELALLPRIGPKLAQSIVASRSASARSPAFRGIDDIQALPGIGPATIREIEPLLAFPATEPPPP
jgi:competence protein ComEA